MLALRIKRININIIASFTTIASGGFGSFGVLEGFEVLDQRASN
jgi:hypothetical protein